MFVRLENWDNKFSGESSGFLYLSSGLVFDSIAIGLTEVQFENKKTDMSKQESITVLFRVA